MTRDLETHLMAGAQHLQKSRRASLGSHMMMMSSSSASVPNAATPGTSTTLTSSSATVADASHNNRAHQRQLRRLSLGQNLHAAFVGNALGGYHNNTTNSSNSDAASVASSTSNSRKSPVKMTRRASLGQMLGSVKKNLTHGGASTATTKSTYNNHKDDTATCISEDSCGSLGFSVHTFETHETNSNSVTARRALIQEIKATIQHHTLRRQEMQETIRSDTALAKARLAAGNQLGACLSMRRVHRTTTHLAYVSAARYQLAQIKNSLESMSLSTSRSNQARAQEDEDQEEEEEEDISEHRKAIREITEKLLKADAPIPSDAFLLHQLESQMQEVGL